ncbi:MULTISPECIES: hypothetical protein [Bacillus]|uniref:Uncharacterized protein n=1 Tax=Bacillus thuringiensis TaxID=1428 RepID=A0A1C4EMK2_BACTU|nr:MULTISPECIES: hypothetical protein [Bacillus]EJR54312.1 hypothetical protein IIM_02041 [Bacillus cereus VD107]MED3024458.1 hypothetical protein [Bacillus wiedmannii]OFD46387.1 hypothetical protein BWGOE3_28910 [Bacillus mycoides]OFD59216.1 hypothetical protein BWGOE6_28600 [Bacillus mycoides]OTY02904.1 hypothetical protein BK729_06975 [Bacillus thuringiensis serovar wratislaviensis]
MEWKLYDEFAVQNDKANEFIAGYREKIKTAKEDVAAATKAYEAILQQEFAGEKVATQKKAALADIEKARAVLKVAEGEYSKANDYAMANLAGTITLDDLARDWRNNFVPTLRQEKVDPLRQKAEQGLKDYFAAVLEILRIESENQWAVEFMNERFRSRKGARPIMQNAAGIVDIPVPPNDSDWNNILKYKQIPARFKS